MADFAAISGLSSALTRAGSFAGVPALAPSAGATLSEQDTFARTLSRARDGEQTPREAAEDFVAQVLVAPILKQMRESEFAAAPFAPSQGEKMFREMLDNATSTKIVHAGSWALVDRVTQKLTGAKGAGSDRAPNHQPVDASTVRDLLPLSPPAQFFPLHASAAATQLLPMREKTAPIPLGLSDRSRTPVRSLPATTPEAAP